MKMKKGVKRVILALIILIVIVFVLFYLLHDDKKATKKVKVINEIKEYGYVLSDNKSEEYKKLFTSLEKVLKEDEVDEEEYVKLISQMFVVDFYSLNDKMAKTDIGGTDFVHSSALTDFLEKAQDTIYKYVESNLYDDRTQKLPTVSKVEVESAEQNAFTYGEEVDEKAYTVKVKWTYSDTEVSNGYQDSAILKFVHEDNKLSLVELGGEE